jgi:hypothetical protein
VYRPVTLLNCDYKIFTKALSLKLAETAPSIIHRDQAGFVPGRSIIDQVKLTEAIINYAEFEEQNGVIIALDQERAYDKVKHNYLWAALQKVNFPHHFINIVKSLYEKAYTSVVINGVRSSRYRVTHGVRQGDPLSCLLFNLAIEPLAQMIRASELEGFKCSGLEYRVIVSLFEDDTTVYLSKGQILRLGGNLTTVVYSLWCKIQHIQDSDISSGNS